MILGIPSISIILAICFLILIFVETKTNSKGVCAIIGTLLNLAAIVLLFVMGADFGAALLFVLAEIIVCYLIVQREDKNAL